MSDKKFNSAIFSSSRGMVKIDPKERFRKELEREKMIERMKLAEKEDVLVRKKELCYQLKGALPDIKQLILHLAELSFLLLCKLRFVGLTPEMQNA
jgi:hypothetical protein